MRSTAGASQFFELSALARQLIAAVRCAAFVLLIVVATWLLVRRTSGAFTWPLPAGVLLAISAVLSIVMASLAGLAGSHPRWPEAIAILAAFVALAAVTLPGTSSWAVAIVWFTLAGAACGVVATRMRPPGLRPVPSAVAAGSNEANDETVSEALVQRLTRHRTQAGGESIHAILRAPCQPGDARVVVHLAFCPPLPGAPKLAAYPIDDSDAEASITAAEMYGARIELRLPQPAVAGDRILLEVVGEALASQFTGDRP